MINGMHAIIYTKEADAVREFFKKTFEVSQRKRRTRMADLWAAAS
jgi:hypothetical protein